MDIAAEVGKGNGRAVWRSSEFKSFVRGRSRSAGRVEWLRLVWSEEKPLGQKSKRASETGNKTLKASYARIERTAI